MYLYSKMAILDNGIYAIRAAFNTAILCTAVLVMVSLLWPELQLFSTLTCCMERVLELTQFVLLQVRGLSVLVAHTIHNAVEFIGQVFRDVMPYVITLSKMIYTRGPVLLKTLVSEFAYIVDLTVTFIRKEKQVCLGIWAFVLIILWIISSLKQNKIALQTEKITDETIEENADHGTSNENEDVDGINKQVDTTENRTTGDSNTKQNQINESGRKGVYARLYPDLSNIENTLGRTGSVDSELEKPIGTSEHDSATEAFSEGRTECADNELNDSREDGADYLDNLCVVCMDNKRNVVVFPCGHVNLCKTCIRSVINGRNACPICLTPVLEYRTVFL